MVLELLINPKKIKGKRWEIFLIGFVYSFIAVFLGLWIFKGYTSIIMISLTVIASMPFVHKMIELEEKKDINIDKEHNLLKEHSKAISMFLFLFLGFIISFSLLYLFLPENITQSVFRIQTETIISINENMITGGYLSISNLIVIFLNNLKILFFCIILSLLYGAGAIFILTWNASVMATAIGSFIKNNLLNVTNSIGYIQVTSLGLLRYTLHGIPEIIAYFIGALASGIISFAIIKHEFMDKNFKHILKDAVTLILIAIIVLFAAGLIEVYISPLL